MQLEESTHQPSWHAELICRQSRPSAIAASAVLFALLIGGPAAAWWCGHLSSAVTVLIYLITVPIMLGVCSSSWAALRSSNWSVAVEPDGLLINLRSYRNYQFPEAQTVLRLPFNEIDSACQHSGWMSQSLDDSTLSSRILSLDLRVVPELSAVRQAIAKERQRRFSRSYFGSSITVQGRSNHVPVKVIDDQIIRITWRSRYDAIRPSLPKFLDCLASRIKETDLSAEPTAEAWDALDEHSFDERLLHLIESGEYLTAIAQLRSRHGYSLSEAKQFVDEVTGRLASGVIEN